MSAFQPGGVLPNQPNRVQRGTTPADGDLPTLEVNGAVVEVTDSTDTPLLWVLRQSLGMPGTRFGCGMALCGACTVHVNGEPVRSCVTPLSAVMGKRVTTIEGINGAVMDALRGAWTSVDVPQCGYCQSGQLMSAAALLASNTSPTDDEVATAMDGNICRCGTYPRIKAAIRAAAAQLNAARAAGAD